VPMLEGRVEHVIGVDTHRDSHAAAILDPTGGLIAQVEIPSRQAGYEQLLRFAAERAAGRRCWALEGTGCYGAGLASFLADRGEWVVEIDRPTRTGRTQAKSDALDAILAGWEAHSREQLACPRQRGHREALRVLQLTRAGAVKVAADARRHLKALLVTAPEPLRASLCRGTWLRQARACAALTAQPNDPVEYRAGVAGHGRAGAGGASGGHPARQGTGCAGPGGGAGAARPAGRRPGHRRAGADQLVAPARLRSEAAFAMLAGAAPIEASSGRVVRHRLNRGGDRQLNRALHTIVMLRECCHQPTRRYVARRTAEGKSEREIRRCLERTVARQLFRLLERQAPARVTA
jgi:transposase